MAELAYGVAQTILEKLASKAYEEISLAKSVKKDLKKFEDMTLNVKSVLEDAEKKQRHNETLKRWLARLKDVFDDAVDVPDEFKCEALRRQVVAKHGSVGGKVRRFFSRSNPVSFRFSLSHQVKEINERFDEIVNEMARFNLIRSQLNGREEQSHGLRETREMTPSFVNPSEVIGREGDKAMIIDMLMNQGTDSTDSNVSVVPIVGIGGLGKTTLAKSVYNDESVVAHFELRLWVCLPLDFNVTESFRELLKSAITATNSTNIQNLSIDQALTRTKDVTNLSIDQMQMFLRSILMDKKIFLVLDDVWNEDVSKWSEVKGLLLMACAKGSKIIVTTRSTKVASVMGTSPLYKLDGLSKEDCFSLLRKYAFGDEQSSAEKFPKLKDIGKQIVEKCKGVPLALKSLGSLLNSNADEREWIRIRDSEIWELEQENNDSILSALKLSYSTMPSYLKQCFAYCSLVPKNVRVENDDMIWMWMALGVVTSPNDNMELEEVGKMYFRELCSRSFFQYLDDAEENFNIAQEFEMHDLIYDLAISIIQNEHSTMNSSTTTVHERVKHLTILLNDGRSQISSMMLQNCKKLRSIHLIVQSDAEGNLDESLISTCVSRFQRIRLLDFDGATFEVLPSSIGKLKHLRYLNLRGNKKLKKLPNAICNLQSLQTLLLKGCTELEELPRDIRNMVSLTTLAVTMRQAYFQEDGIGQLKRLRTLIVSMCNNLRALPRDMRHCTSLRTLIISRCEQLELASSPDQPDEALSLNMSLQILVIWDLPKTTALPYWVQAAANTLQQLFVIDCQELAALPEWLPDLTALLTLALLKCPKLSSLPDGTQRLTSLTQLIVNECDSLEEKCEPEVGEDWHMIAHIPNISIGFDHEDDDKDNVDDDDDNDGDEG